MASTPNPTWRLPLQTGEAALNAIGKGALYWLPALVFAGGSVLVAWSIDVDVLFAVIVTPALICAGFCWRHLSRAWRLRPSDLELTATGFRVLGGERDGFALAFRDVAEVRLLPGTPGGWSVGELLGVLLGDDLGDLHRLQVRDAVGTITPLALSSSTAELASLEDAAATLTAAALPNPPTRPELPPQVPRCPSCRGPVPPAADPTTTCPWCSAQVQLPEETREKVRAAETLAQHPARAIARVLAQPSARVIATQYGFVAALMLAAWPIAAVVAAVRPMAGWSLGMLALFIAGSVLGAWSVFRTRLAERQALRLLTVRFGALTGDGAGKPRRCHACQGPLPVRAGAVLVDCAWCDAPNVLGVDRTVEARAARLEERSLHDVLARRAAERRLWRRVGVAGVVILAGSGYALVAAVLRT